MNMYLDIEDIKSNVCDNYCKYAAMCESELDQEALLDEHCDTCILKALDKVVYKYEV